MTFQAPRNANGESARMNRAPLARVEEVVRTPRLRGMVMVSTAAQAMQERGPPARNVAMFSAVKWQQRGCPDLKQKFNNPFRRKSCSK